MVLCDKKRPPPPPTQGIVIYPSHAKTKKTLSNSLLSPSPSSFHPMKKRKKKSPNTISTLTPQPNPISPQRHRRHQPQRQTHKPQNRIPPPDAQHLVHSGRKQRKTESGHRSNESCSARGRGGVGGVGIYDVTLRTVEADDEADGENAGADVGDDPVDFVFGCPAVEEEAWRWGRKVREGTGLGWVRGFFL